MVTHSNTTSGILSHALFVKAHDMAITSRKRRKYAAIEFLRDSDPPFHEGDTVNREMFVLKIFHEIIFRVIFSYASRPYENILTTEIFQYRKFLAQSGTTHTSRERWPSADRMETCTAEANKKLM